MDQEARQNHFVAHGAAKELLIGVSTRSESLLQFGQRIVRRVDRGNSERIGIDRAVFFSREVRGCFLRQAFEGAGEKVRLRGWRQPMADEKILDQEEIADGRHDRRQKNADSAFALPGKLVKRFQSKRQISLCDRFAEIENSALPGLWNEHAHLVPANATAAPESGFELLEFTFELEGVQSHARGQNFDCIGIQLQVALANARDRPLDDGLFAPTKAKIRKIVNVCCSIFSIAT